jgi:hypothetical protein
MRSSRIALVAAVIGMAAVAVSVSILALRAGEEVSPVWSLSKGAAPAGELRVIDSSYRAARLDRTGGDPPAPEEYLCLWTSVEVTPNPPGYECDVTAHTIDALCSPQPGILVTATAFYQAGAREVDDYVFGPGSLYWGYLPGLPTGWCWILNIDWSVSGVPYLPKEYLLDRASGYNHGLGVPPLLGYCGWPLASEPPPPFLFSCP